MAGRSLLHQFGWHRGEYRVEKVAAIFASKPAIMDGNFRKQQTRTGNLPILVINIVQFRSPEEMQYLYDLNCLHFILRKSSPSPENTCLEMYCHL